MDCQNGWQDRDRLMVYIQKHFKELRRLLFRGTLGNFGTGAIAPCKQIGVFRLVPQPSQLVHGLVWHTSRCDWNNKNSIQKGSNQKSSKHLSNTFQKPSKHFQKSFNSISIRGHCELACNQKWCTTAGAATQ